MGFLSPRWRFKKKEFEMKKVNVKCRWRTNIHCICNYCEKNTYLNWARPNHKVQFGWAYKLHWAQRSAWLGDSETTLEYSFRKVTWDWIFHCLRFAQTFTTIGSPYQNMDSPTLLCCFSSCSCSATTFPTSLR
jgi:hypothetical protein